MPNFVQIAETPWRQSLQESNALNVDPMYLQGVNSALIVEKNNKRDKNLYLISFFF
jgi:hypothetical protein